MTNKGNSDLLKLATDAGFSFEEFHKQIINNYAAFIDVRLDNAPEGNGIEHRVNYGTHVLSIKATRETLDS